MAEVDDFRVECLYSLDRVDCGCLEFRVGVDVRGACDLGSELVGVPDDLGTDDPSPIASLDKYRLVAGCVSGCRDDRYAFGDAIVTAHSAALRFGGKRPARIGVVRILAERLVLGGLDPEGIVPPWSAGFWPQWSKCR